MEKDRVILTMFRDDVRRMIENAEDKKLDNVLTFFKSANVYSGAADSPIVHVVFPRLEWNLHNPLVRFVEGFLKRNYCSMELDEKDPSVIDRVKQGKPMFFEYGIFLFFSFIVYAGLSFFRGAIDFDSDSVIGLIELARFAFMFFTGLLFAVGIGELNKEKFEWKSEF